MEGIGMDYTKIWPQLAEMWAEGTVEGAESVWIDHRTIEENGQRVLVRVVFRDFSMYLS